MSGDTFAQIVGWSVFAAVIGGIIYLFHRLTAPAAKRINDNIAEWHFAGMIARGRSVPLPKTWLSGGLAGHDWNTDPGFQRMVRQAGLTILAFFLLGLWLRRNELTMGQAMGEALLMLVIVGGTFLGFRYWARREVRQTIAAAGASAPRTAFKVVANAHGLFVPVGDRVMDGAWADWTITGCDIWSDKYGRSFCNSVTLAHRSDPTRKIPIIGSTFQDGEQLMDVIAARVARQA